MTAKRFILNETSYHGQGAAAAIIDEIKSRGFNKALIVTDADLIKFGVVKKITDLLEAEGFAYAVFDGVKANPSVGVVKAGVEAFKAAGADYMIAVGGGSPQDTAKGIGIIINNPEFADVVSLEGTAPTRHKSVPVIAVATTAGTAAETTINYVITDEEKRFYINLTNDKSSGCKIKSADLYRYITVRDKYGKAIKKMIPQFDVKYIPSSKEPIFRDIPNKAFTLLFDHIAINHTELLGLVMHQAFAGLRPSEACNVRRIDSPLGAGIRIREVNGKLCGVSIDLRDELNLRSDLLSVGNIKKERIAKVPDIFLSAYKDAYEIYMAYMENKPYEADYGAFSVNGQGRAITYDSYYNKFREIIKEEMIPIYLNSNDDELVLYGQTLMEHSLSPHVFRHWFTVQLVLSGINEPGILMAFRGDTSPESALTYISNKGELEKQFSKITNETFDYTLWAAKKKYNEGI